MEKKTEWKMTKLEKEKLAELARRKVSYVALLDDLAALQDQLYEKILQWWSGFLKDHNVPKEVCPKLVADHVAGIVMVRESGIDILGKSLSGERH